MEEKASIKVIKSLVRNIPDFPKKDILFRDITTVLQEPHIFNSIVDKIADYYYGKGITKIVAVESRGFILGGALAKKLNAGFVPVRKAGKLPAPTYAVSYQLEYGKDTLELHKDALTENDVVLIHDDLLATGGTIKAVLELLSNFNLKTTYISFLIELNVLNGRESLKTANDIFSLIHFND